MGGKGTQHTKQMIFHDLNAFQILTLILRVMFFCGFFGRKGFSMRMITFPRKIVFNLRKRGFMREMKGNEGR